MATKRELPMSEIENMTFEQKQEAFYEARGNSEYRIQKKIIISILRELKPDMEMPDFCQIILNAKNMADELEG